MRAGGGGHAPSVLVTQAPWAFWAGKRSSPGLYPALLAAAASSEVVSLPGMGLLELCEEVFGTADLYRVLGVRREASDGEVRRGYHKVSLQVHPDRVGEGDKEDATRRFQVCGVTPRGRRAARMSPAFWPPGPVPGERAELRLAPPSDLYFSRCGFGGRSRGDLRILSALRSWEKSIPFSVTENREQCTMSREQWTRTLLCSPKTETGRRIGGYSLKR